MDTTTQTHAAARSAEKQASRLGHRLGSWRLDHHDAQAFAECILCGEQMGVLTLERSVIGRAASMACSGVA